MTTASLICLGLLSGAGAGLLAGLVGIGGGIVVVPVVYYGLVSSGVPGDQAAHVAAPHVRVSVLIGVFAAFCLVVAVRFAAPGRFRPMLTEPSCGNWRRIS